MAVEPGTVIAKRYRVISQLGKGGMGEVFSAENTRTGRRVALKVLRAESKQKQSAIERFRREARAAGAINSDFVTQVLDVDDDPEYGIVLVFELLEGESLVERLKRTGPIGYEELWGIVEAVWMGLADAHAAGIIHRDLKPSNVFLEQRRSGRRVKILDFGISKLPKKISTQSLTQVGQSLGTFSFMPPEQIGKAKTVDHRADIYACTTLIYQAMSGKLPYQAKNVVAMMELKNKTEPRTLGEVMRTPVDPRLEAFIAKGLSRDPDTRFQTALEALEGWRALRPPGAQSVIDLEASGAYSGEIEDAPSSGEIATTVLHKSKIQERMRQVAAQRAKEEQAQRAAAAPAVATPAVATPAVATPAVATPAGATPAGATPSPQPAPQPPPEPAPASIDQTIPSGPAAESAKAAALKAREAKDARPRAAFKGPSEHQLVTIPPPRSKLRTTATLVIGALLLMSVGFGTVALVMHLMSGG